MLILEYANEFYDGSNLLLPISRSTGLSIDKVNFLVCQFVALLLGFPYRTLLGPHRVSATVRHIVQVLFGVPLMFFCFGWQVKHIFLLTAICLVAMWTLKPGIMEHVVFVIAMGYLCVTHIYRMVYDYGGYTLDITGPLMISTQRLTSLACNIADGRTDESNLSDNMERLAVRKFPSLLEYVSYIFCFHGLMCGPFCFYKDYIEFINGCSYSPLTESSSDQDIGNSHDNSVRRISFPPDPTPGLISKFVSAAICGLLLVFIVPHFLVISIIEPDFATHSFWYKAFFLMLSTSLHRQRYYFAWKLSELVNINAGLGFNGYDSQGRPKWDLIDNTNIYQVETATSLKVLLDNWNKMTTQWLRYVIYERLHSTLAVFLISAFWHGFYIGYYLTFLGGGIFIHVSRLVRRRVRPVFQKNWGTARLYDVITFAGTRASIAYLTFPFVLLEFWPAVAVYAQLFFCLHIGALFLGAVLLLWPRSRAERSKQL